MPNVHGGKNAGGLSIDDRGLTWSTTQSVGGCGEEEEEEEAAEKNIYACVERASG